MLPSAESIQIILPITSIFFLILSFRRPIYGVIAYFIILNAKIGEMYPILGAIRFELVAAIIVLISILVTKLDLGKISPKKNGLNKYFWILVVVGLLSVPQAVDVSESWKYGGYNLIKLALFYCILVLSIENRNDLNKFIWAFVLVSAWTAYEPVTNYLRGIGNIYGYGRVAIGSYGAASGHVALANTLNQAIPIAFYWALTKKKKAISIIIWCLPVLLVAGVIFSKSRGGFVGLITISAGLIYFSKSKARSIAIIAIILVLLLPFIGHQYFDRMASIKKGIWGSRSTSDRYLGLVNGLSMMQKRPLLGVGIGCFARARYIYFRYYFYSHNLYGELFGELGLASMAWFYWIFMLFKRTAWLKRKMMQVFEKNEQYIHVLTGVQLSLVVRLVLGNFSHCAFIWFWFVMAGLIVSIDNILKREHPIVNLQ